MPGLSRLRATSCPQTRFSILPVPDNLMNVAKKISSQSIKINIRCKLKSSGNPGSEEIISISDVVKPEDIEPGIYLVDVSSIDDLNQFMQNLGMDQEQTEG